MVFDGVVYCLNHQNVTVYFIHEIYLNLQKAEYGQAWSEELLFFLIYFNKKKVNIILYSFVQLNVCFIYAECFFVYCSDDISIWLIRLFPFMPHPMVYVIVNNMFFFVIILFHSIFALYI